MESRATYENYQEGDQSYTPQQQEDQPDQNIIFKSFFFMLFLISTVLEYTVTPVTHSETYVKFSNESRKAQKKMKREWRRWWKGKSRKNKYAESASFITDKMLSSSESESDDGGHTHP